MKKNSSLFRATWKRDVIPVVVAALAVMACCALVMTSQAVSAGRASVIYVEDEMVVPEESEFSDFVFNSSGVSLGGRAVAWFGFFLFRLCRSGWSVQPAYKLSVAVGWLLVSGLLLLVLARQLAKTNRDLRSGSLAPRSDRQYAKELASFTLLKGVFLIIMTLVALVSWLVTGTPMGILFWWSLIFVLVRGGYLWCVFQAKWHAKDFGEIETIRKALKSLSKKLTRKLRRNIKGSKPYKLFREIRWKIQRRRS